jgi:hypothetical protein
MGGEVLWDEFYPWDTAGTPFGRFRLRNNLGQLGHRAGFCPVLLKAFGDRQVTSE